MSIPRAQVGKLLRTSTDLSDQAVEPRPCAACRNLFDRWYSFPDEDVYYLKVIDHSFDMGSQNGCAFCVMMLHYAEGSKLD